MAIGYGVVSSGVGPMTIWPVTNASRPTTAGLLTSSARRSPACTRGTLSAALRLNHL